MIDAMRRFVLAGWRDANWLRTDSRVESLRGRADFQEIVAAVDDLTAAEETVGNPAATPAEKVAARRKVLALLEGQARPLPPSRLTRRTLAQARQELGRGLLEAGQEEEARAAFDEAMAERRQLIEEASTDKTLRIALNQSEIATGDLLAASGRLKEAVAAWEKGVVALEADLKANPIHIPLQVATSTELVHVAREEGKVGLFDESLGHFRRAFAIQAFADDFLSWYEFGTLLLEAGARAEYDALTVRAPARLDTLPDDPFRNVARMILLVPDPAPQRVEALKQAIKRDPTASDRWAHWIRGMAWIRLGQPEKGLALLKSQDPVYRWTALALAHHQFGHREEAERDIAKADRTANHLMQRILASDSLKVDDWWQDWCLRRILRREAHRAIEGKPLPEAPYDRLHHARMLVALGRDRGSRGRVRGGGRVATG